MDSEEKGRQSRMANRKMQVEDKPESDTEERAEPPGASSTNNRRRIVTRSEPMAVTTQEAVGGFREKAMRMASVEQIDLDRIMELSITCQVLRWAKQSNFSGGVPLRKADERNMNSPQRALVVTIREGEERGMCSATMRELLRIVKDQMREKYVVAIVLSRESTFWRKANVKTLLRQRKLKYIDVEAMRVVTNDKHIAEQIKSDSTLSVQGNLLLSKVESVVMNESEDNKI